MALSVQKGENSSLYCPFKDLRENRIRQTVGIIGRARGFMTGPQLLLLYNTMVLPHLQYCLLNWGNFSGDGNSGLRAGLMSLQKSLVRIITESNNPISRVGKVIKPGLKKTGFYYRVFSGFFKWILKKPGFFWVFSNSSEKSWKKLRNLKKR